MVGVARTVAWLCLIAMAIGLGFWVVAGSESFQTCSEQEQHAAPPQTQESSREILISRVKIARICFGAFLDASNAAIGAIATVFIAAFTTVLAIYTARLFRATKALVEVDRPHMWPESVVIGGIQNQPNADGLVPLNLTYRFRNFGKSPAMLQSMCLMTGAFSTPGPVPDYGAPMQALRYVVPVNGTYGSRVPFEFTQPAEDILRVFIGDDEFHFWGWLKYRGAGGPEHMTKFAFRMIFDDQNASVHFAPAGGDAYWEYT